MRKTVWFVGVVTGLTALVATSAAAQDKRVNVVFGAGYTAPFSDVRDHLGDGFNVTFGVQVNATPTLGIETLYSFNGLGEKRISLPVSVQPLEGSVPTDFFGDMNMQYLTFAAVLQKPEGDARPYGLAGLGYYHRPVHVTTPGVGYVPGYCSPWWYVCYPGGWIPVDYIVGERSSNDFGMVFGGGVTMKSVFAEVRYHYIWGPEIELNQPVQPIAGAPAPGDRKANGQFLALTFGLRF